MPIRGERPTGAAVSSIVALTVGSIGSLVTALNLWARDTWTELATVASVVGVVGLIIAGAAAVKRVRHGRV